MVCSNHCASLSLLPCFNSSSNRSLIIGILPQFETFSSKAQHHHHQHSWKYTITGKAESMIFQSEKKIMCSKIQHRKSDDRFWQETSLFLSTLMRRQWYQACVVVVIRQTKKILQSYRIINLKRKTTRLVLVVDYLS